MTQSGNLPRGTDDDGLATDHVQRITRSCMNMVGMEQYLFIGHVLSKGFLKTFLMSTFRKLPFY